MEIHAEYIRTPPVALNNIALTAKASSSTVRPKSVSICLKVIEFLFYLAPPRLRFAGGSASSSSSFSAARAAAASPLRFFVFAFVFSGSASSSSDNSAAALSEATSFWAFSSRRWRP